MRFLTITLFACLLFANEQTNAEYINKQELLLKHNQKILKQIDEAKQELEAFKAAFNALQKEKEEQNLKKQQELEKILKSIEEEKQKNQDLLDKIQENVKQLSELTNEKVITSFSKMKEGPAATILDAMEPNEAANILRFLEPKKMGQILAKMPPQKAAQISLLISNNNTNKPQSKEQEEIKEPQITKESQNQEQPKQIPQEQKDKLKELSKIMTE